MSFAEKRDVKMKERTEEIVENKGKCLGTIRNEPGSKAVTSDKW
jgi:hypothetical protein